MKAAESAEGDGEHSEANGQDHAGHGHVGHDHGAEDPNSLELSTQARENIGLRTKEITLEPFERTTVVPAIIAERPGRSVVDVSAPLTGVVTRVYPIEGEALAPGQPLFDLRMTHEELVQAQSDFLEAVENLDVVGKEIERLTTLAEGGAIAGKTLLERKYEQQKLEATIQSQRQALLLHGLSEAQIDEIVSTRELVRATTVVVPASGDAAEQLLQVQQLSVELGQHVEAGAALCVLVDHALLYVEGRAFAVDAAALQCAATEGWKLALLGANAPPPPQAGGALEILYVADRVDTESRTLAFYARLPNELVVDKAEGGRRFIGWRYKPGERAELRLPVERWEDRIVLPATAVVRDGVDTFVFQQTGKKFTRRPVHVEYSDPLWAIVANDGSIFPGDIVAVTGAAQMQIALKNRSGGAIDPHAGHNH